MPCKPAFGDRTVDACPKLAGTAASPQERRIDELDVDPAILHRLNRACDLDQLAGGDIRIGEGGGAGRISSCLGLHVRGPDVHVHVVDAKAKNSV